MSKSLPYSDVDSLKCMLRALYGSERDELAMKLLTRFGDIYGVLTASYETLCSVPGVTERVALFLSSVLPFKRQVLLRDPANQYIKSREDAEKFARLYFSVDNAATSAIISLDKRGKIKFVYNREINSVRDLMAEICKTDAERFIFVKYSTGPDPVEISHERICTIERIQKLTQSIACEFVGYIAIAVDGSIATHWLADEKSFPQTRPIKDDKKE